jgi:hypothetical protein
VAVKVQLEEEVVVYSSPYLDKMNNVLSKHTVRSELMMFKCASINISSTVIHHVSHAERYTLRTKRCHLKPIKKMLIRLQAELCWVPCKTLSPEGSKKKPKGFYLEPKMVILWGQPKNPFGNLFSKCRFVVASSSAVCHVQYIHWLSD